jgi:hypothetical protein
LYFDCFFSVSITALVFLFPNLLPNCENFRDDFNRHDSYFILLGLIVVEFLLPELIKIKLPGGLEAELIQPKETISTGPKSDIGFGSSSPSISSGPR